MLRCDRASALVAVLLSTCSGLAAAAPPGVFMMPPPKEVQSAAPLPSIAPIAADSPILLTPPASNATTIAEEAANAPTPPAPLPPPSQCSCNTKSLFGATAFEPHFEYGLQEIRSLNATFTNTTSDPKFLNATTSSSWTSLYIVPNVAIPNTTADLVFFQAQIVFSHPVQYINSAQIRLYTNALNNVLQSVAPQLSEIQSPTCTGGFVEPAPPFSPEQDATITSVYETADCKSLYIRGFAPLLTPLATNATQLELDVSASSLIDACGERFPGTSIITSIRSKQVAELYALGLAYTPRLGPVTDSSVVKLAGVFTQAVPGINSSFFAVSGPKKATVSHLRLVAGSQSYYAFSVTVSDGYYGSVNVTMTPAAAEMVLLSNSTLPYVSFQKLAVQC